MYDPFEVDGAAAITCRYDVPWPLGAALWPDGCPSAGVAQSDARESYAAVFARLQRHHRARHLLRELYLSLRTRAQELRAVERGGVPAMLSSARSPTARRPVIKARR